MYPQSTGRNPRGYKPSRPDSGFGLRLRVARVSAGMNAYELERRTGIDHQTIYRWEAGREPMLLGPVRRVAIPLGVSPYWLLTGCRAGRTAPIR